MTGSFLETTTVVVSGAAGACGTAAGQVAKTLAISILKYIRFYIHFPVAPCFRYSFNSR